MPCNTIVLNKVEIRVANRLLLPHAIGALPERDQLVLMRAYGVGSIFLLADQIVSEGFVRVPVGQEYLADRIKQEYSRQAIRSAARKFNWRVQENPRQKNKLTATRRV